VQNSHADEFIVSPIHVKLARFLNPDACMSALNTTIFRGAVAFAFVALAACASADKAQEPRVASESQTGSNIPKKSADRVQTINTDGMQPLPPPSRPPTGSGGG
jgi:hypothetical protein